MPQIKGVEKRKAAPSAAGVLGVEGQERTLLRELLVPFAVDGEIYYTGSWTNANGSVMRFNNGVKITEETVNAE